MPPDPSAKGSKRAIRLGKYQVVEHIATGGMGAVYKAVDTALGREVALKVLPPEMAANPATLERFKREAKAAASLRHENIVTLYDFNEERGTYYLAMEFVAGKDLHEYITRKGKLDPAEARTILLQAALALDHAHKKKIVHRDIKPSNFLLTRKGDRLVVKLTDLGLARHVSDAEFRVTRSGTTVGTVDYMSPEQARDSGKADVRSDIYSLGCTLYHMLAGRPPFPDGGLTERLYKHIQDEPPDVTQFNPKVPEGMQALLRRMLAKRPEDRYQTAADLLHDLNRLDSLVSPNTQRDILAHLALAAGEKPDDSGSRRAPPGHRPPPTRRRLRPPETDTVEAEGPTQSAAFWLVVGSALLLAAGVAIIVALALRPRNKDTGTGTDDAAAPENAPETAPAAAPNTGTPSGTATGIVQPPPQPAAPPRLFPSAPPFDAARLKEYAAPWDQHPLPPAATPPLRVSRLPPAGAAGHFSTLAAACEAAPKGQTTIIEIADNGPLFEAPAATEERNLVLRAADGYRPLLVWDLGAPKSKPPGKEPTFLALAKGSLVLENLDVVLKWTSANGPEPATLFHVTSGDFDAAGCTFSVAGKHPAGVTLVRQDGTLAGGRTGKCRLSRCFARGSNLTALDLRSPGTDVLIDHSLLAGGEPPLLAVTAADQTPTTLRVLRSTLVAGQTLLRVRPVAAGNAAPALDWHGCDSLLARCSDVQSAGELVSLIGERGRVSAPSADNLKWRAINCLYAGWKTLLSGAEPIPGSAEGLQAWHRRWGQADGDSWAFSTWPATLHDVAELVPEAYRVKESDKAVYFASAVDPATPLGCDLRALPPARDNWLGLTYDRFVTSPVEPLADAAPPPIPDDADGRYHGGPVDVSAVDLGAHLREMEAARKLGPKVVLNLFSSRGPQAIRPFSPVHVKGSSLVLHAEPAPEPLPLKPDGKTGTEHGGLIVVEDGNLDLVGLEILCPNSPAALLPRHVLRVRNGDLRLYRCRLSGPLTLAPKSYQGLVRFEGSVETTPEKARACALNESLLVSGKVAVEVAAGGARLLVQQCAIVAGTDAFHFDPGPGAKPRLNVQGTLEENTFAAGQAVLHVEDAPHLAVPAEPIVVQARKGNVFLAPFADVTAPSGMLLGGGNALARGLLVWQGEDNAYDKRLDYYAAAGSAPQAAQPYAVWSRLWGTAGERALALDVPPTKKLEMANAYPQLDRLELPLQPRLKRPLGANLAQLGIKPKRP